MRYNEMFGFTQLTRFHEIILGMRMLVDSAGQNLGRL